jgi:tRNA threonylcarbamoyladenosine biosynthesis protein TsaB
MLLVDEVLKNSGLSPSDIDIFACSSGPGSFTGLRIGASVIKGMAKTMKKPVVGVPTLDALAYNLYGCSGLVCPMLDAQRNMVYSALYSWDKGGFKKLEDFGAILVEELLKKLKSYAAVVTFLGDNKFKTSLV